FESDMPSHAVGSPREAKRLLEGEHPDCKFSVVVQEKEAGILFWIGPTENGLHLGMSDEADRLSGALTDPCQPLPQSRGGKPKKHGPPPAPVPKKRLDISTTTPQVSPLSTQPPQEPPPATAPRQEQPASKLKQIAKRMMSLWHWLRKTTR